MEFHGSQQSQKKTVMKKVKTFVGRMLSHQRRHKPAGVRAEGATGPQGALLSHLQSLLPGGAEEPPSPGLPTVPRPRKLSQNGNHGEHPVKWQSQQELQLKYYDDQVSVVAQTPLLFPADPVTVFNDYLLSTRYMSATSTIQLDVEAETEEITRGNTLLRARRTTKRLSVTSLPAGLQKVPYSSKKRPHFPALKKKKRGVENILRKSDLTVGKLQMQVDDLIETVTDKSMKLLAQRHAELQQCEFLGDEILQSSKQFRRISKRTTRKYKLKNVCFPCTCCCF
ncbi:PREDICTED: putative uncharacterized protein C3orf49 [Miniopterus natalensis]|uniref:putative uncharacterized protein C3orf49 n=1 Tax=Miniopterus natalensis TaxID=291302 RepID=UPI0007A6AFC0|nr:PREDICTED: putative uncharacterized protein C3orf49 [Miniopterus natalensis]